MNYILYNIALIFIGWGIILMTIYITKASTNSFKTTNQILLEKQEYLKNNSLQPNNETIYDLKPSNIYNKMFSNSSVWFGYSDFNEKDITDKIYIKSI
jgi:hypothetical protein